VAPGKDGWNWAACRDGGFIAIGWDELGDLRKMTPEEFERKADDLVDVMNDWTKFATTQVWKFAQIGEGDRIVANRGTSTILGIGTVAGPYYFVEGERHAHRLPVRWDDLTTRQVNEYGWRRTLIELDAEKFDSLSKAPPGALARPTTQPAIAEQNLLKKLGVGMDRPRTNLHPQVEAELWKFYDQMEEDGRLFSRKQRDEYLSNFRERFGPEVLRSLQGEELLQTMHEHGSKDSLVYWLEFKDDEEFPARFGSIAGGSALKFGIYKRKETGAWMAGSPQKQVELTVAEAVAYAEKHREQLLRGCALMEELATGGTDEEYQVLQEEMDRLAPDVSDLAWGHKYFSLLYPDKLDDYHNEAYKRFHLMKLLQVPPTAPGRYVCAGRFVDVAGQMDIPVGNLTSLLNARNGRPYRYWRVGTSNEEKPRNRWDLMREGSCIAVGWDKVGDLSDIAYDRASKERVRELIGDTCPDKSPQVIGRETQQLFNFAAVLEEGDIVLAADGQTIIGVGRIAGNYLYDPSSDFPHRRPVDWLRHDEWQLPQKKEGVRTSVHPLRRFPENLVEIERRILTAGELVPIVPAVVLKPGVPRLTGVPGRIQSILERKGQVILYGPPGTGKTYWAEKTAIELAAHHSFGKAFTRLDVRERARILGKEGSAGLVRMCTFHPAYGYEDFLEGYRPEVVGESMLFVPRDGVFKKLCDDARGEADRFYLLVDEINRGDIPRIFGELLTVMEKDKRDKPVQLPLSANSFSVPPNVYVIGTMNTADRSIALLDTALRRRFGFIELMPDSSLLGKTAVEGISLGPWLDAVNAKICDHVGRDARNLQIGHSYLMEGEKAVSELSKLSHIVREDIIPLLEEYCYEDYAALANILGKGLVDEAAQRIRHELFGPGREDDLVQALLSHFPEVSTSSKTVASEAEQVEEEVEEGEEEAGYSE